MRIDLEAEGLGDALRAVAATSMDVLELDAKQPLNTAT